MRLPTAINLSFAVSVKQWKLIIVLLARQMRGVGSIFKSRLLVLGNVFMICMSNMDRKGRDTR